MSLPKQKALGVEIKDIGEPIGKGLFATQKFKEGEIIFEESPIVACQFSWNAFYGYLSCDYCMRPLETALENARRLAVKPELCLPYPELCTTKNPQITCSHCGVYYCSETCLHLAWDLHHKILCLRTVSVDPGHPLVILQEMWKQMHYPPETASIMLLARILATILQSENKEETAGLFLKFRHRTINEEEEIAHKLLGKEFQDQLDTLRHLLHRFLGGPEIHHWLTPDGFRSLVALVGTNGQGIGTSPLSEWVKKCEALSLPDEERKVIEKFIDDLYEKLDAEAGGFLNNEGSGLFLLQSTCNHSCEPNALATFPCNDFNLTMTALRDIEIGDEICVSYLDECNLERSRHSRIKVLRENYLFTCHCSKCESQADDPDITSEEEMSEDEESFQDN